MIVVKVLGGLGNQMFQYALYLSLKMQGKEVYLDTKACRKYKRHQGYLLEYVFKIQSNEAKSDVITRLIDSSSVINEERLDGFYEDYNKVEDKYFDGYWQNPQYFESISPIIHHVFIDYLKIDKRNNRFLDSIRQETTVGLHVRRGDYIKKESANKLHGNICTLMYYKNAIEYCNKHIKNFRFVVFSDDIKWCKSELELPENTIFVNWNKGKSCYKDIYLMSHCTHNIIANSSFSWWGAWLNQNPEKIIIAPDKWKNKESYNISDILPSDWIRMSIK